EFRRVLFRSLLSELAPLVTAQHGMFYIMETQDSTQRLKLLYSYGHKGRNNLAHEWNVGEGLVGQCAFEKQRITLTNVPGDYVQITSGLGHASPLNIMVLPVLFEGEVKAVIELGSFNLFSEIHQTFLQQLTESIGIVLNTIGANTRTEMLLSQSQDLAKELQSQQGVLQQTNEELAVNAEGNLTPQQVNYGRTIHAAGTDLLNLINDILDLSKIESGTVTVEASEVLFADLRDQMDRTFRHIAADKGLQFNIELAPNLPRSLYTDAKRLQQVLKNLLSNAFKF